MVDYWSNFRPRQGIFLFNALVGVSLYIRDGEIWAQETKNISLYRMVQKVFRYLGPFGRDLRV